MEIIEDNSLTEFYQDVTAKDSRYRKSFRNIAWKFVLTNEPDETLKGMRFMASEVNSHSQLLVLRVYNGILVFNEPKAEILAKIDKLPKRKEVPEKVAVKMATLRLKNLFTELTRVNKWLTSQQISAKQNPSMNFRSWECHEIPDSLKTKKDFENFVLKLNQAKPDSVYGIESDFYKQFRDFGLFLERSEITDSVLEEAMGRLQVKTILES